MAHTFRLHNTLTRRTEPLKLIEPDHLRIYGCGPTVYSHAHIGNFRSFLTADLIVRTAKALNWRVTYVTNITDVGHLTGDDTIDPSGEDRMARAISSQQGKRFANVWDLARYFTEELLTDWRTLNLLEPAVRPRATEHVGEQIRAVEALIARGLAYETSQAVYFAVPDFAGYGKLSGNTDSAALTQAVRDVVVDPQKRDPRDFALWKKDPDHLMQWHSPWGWGFPGWHIECSVMAQTYLGPSIDLHTGGEDLIFPHHECEIAQAEGLCGEPFARYWVHTRFLQVEGRKMSKRLGNFHTVRELIQEHKVHPLALRLALISGQYRKPFNFTLTTLRDCERLVHRFADAWTVAAEGVSRAAEGPDELGESLNSVYEAALGAMLDDLNTPVAIAKTLEGTKLIRTYRNKLSLDSARSATTFLSRIEDLLGVIQGAKVEETSDGESTAREPDLHITTLVAERAAARRARNWARADAIRDELQALGITLKDSPEGTTWQKKSTL